MIDRRYVASVLVILSLVTLTSGAYAISPVPPPEQAFDGSGFIYTVGYECGSVKGDYDFALAGTYMTDIMIHNPTDRDQTYVIKFFMLKTTMKYIWKGMELPFPLITPPVWSSDYVIKPDGAADIDCYDIDTYVKATKFFSKGLVIISHPLLGGGEPKVPLDVIVAYTYRTDAGASKDVLLVPGVYVSKVPTPPIKPPA